MPLPRVPQPLRLPVTNIAATNATRILSIQIILSLELIGTIVTSMAATSAEMSLSTETLRPLEPKTDPGRYGGDERNQKPRAIQSLKSKISGLLPIGAYQESTAHLTPLDSRTTAVLWKYRPSMSMPRDAFLVTV